MARRRFSRRRAPRRRRVRSDIVPISLCHDQLAVTPAGTSTFWTCAKPFLFAIPLVDGGALDNILRIAAETALQPQDYRDAQAVSRGISFNGAQFDFVLSFVGDPNESFDSNVFDAFFVTASMAICALPTQRAEDGTRGPMKLPNLFSPLEEEVEDILYRWHLRFPLFAFDPELPTNPVTAVALTDTTGAGANIFVYRESTTTYWSGGSEASSNRTHHRVKSRRFLNENKAIYLCGSLEIPEVMHDTMGLGIDMLGYMALKQR